MKITTLITLLAQLILILSKDKLKIKKNTKNSQIIQNLPDTITHSSVPYDDYTLQHAAVKYLFKV